MPDNSDHPDLPPFLLADEIRAALRYDAEEDAIEAEAQRQRELDAAAEA